MAATRGVTGLTNNSLTKNYNMAVSVDDVYQKVLVIANKEQRGYITPQEFNMLANRAQIEIFNDYFNDIKTAYHKAKNQTSHSDELDMLSEKLALHKATGTGTFTSAGQLSVGSDRRLASLYYTYPAGSNYRVYFEELDTEEFFSRVSNPLSRPTKDRPSYRRTGAGGCQTWPKMATGTSFSYEYYEKPEKANWSYVVINDKALYNDGASTDFDLHWTEEENLVNKILEMVGIVINKVGLTQTVGQISQRQKQEDND